MQSLPLFPLNTVLFPGTPLHLHIFEERYKQMISFCLENKLPFGVNLIKHGIEAFGPLAEPYHIGCTANIYQVQQLKNGDMNIVVYGQDRFRILSIVKDELPYLTARIKLYPLLTQNQEGLMVNRDKLFEQVSQYIQALLSAGKSQVELREIPDDPGNLANFCAAILQIPPKDKQRLLSFENIDALTAELVKLYQRELLFVNTLLEEKESKGIGSFSVN